MARPAPCARDASKQAVPPRHAVQVPRRVTCAIARARVLCHAAATDTTTMSPPATAAPPAAEPARLPGMAPASMTVEYAPGKSLTIETGEIGRLAGGAVLVTAGDTIVYTTACVSPEPTSDGSFAPLQVHFVERMSAGGRTLGGYVKRDGRPKEGDTLTSRLVDRPLRPLFPKGWAHDTQVLQWLLSYDGANVAQPHAVTAAAAALLLSDAAFRTAVAGVQVGRVGGAFIVNPTPAEMEKSDLDLTMAGTARAVLMIEGFADFLPEEVVLEAIEVGQAAIAAICTELQAWAEGRGKVAKPLRDMTPDAALRGKLESEAGPRLAAALQTVKKEERGAALEAVRRECIEAVAAAEAPADEKAEVALRLELEKAFAALRRDTMRELLLEQRVRPDGRGPGDIRPIAARCGLLPRVHGSALFTRGETQALVTATLGNSAAVQRQDTLAEGSDQSFYLQYFFPPSSVGETGRVGAAGRREIGHGKLAERALAPAVVALPGFPYVMRLESLITESNGSSSMASVCGGCLALLDAGVPMRRRVAGIAMGLVLAPGGGCVVLSDILGIEDALGDMDFKVAGDADAITAFQMDIKVEGVTVAILREALAAARAGRRHILGEMAAARPAPRGGLSAHCERLLSLDIAEDKIGGIIGPGGKNIRKLIERFKVSDISIDQSGRGGAAPPSPPSASSGSDADAEGEAPPAPAAAQVVITYTVEQEAAAREAQTYIAAMVTDPAKGDVFTACKVLRTLDVGAVVELPGGRDAFVHISELSVEPVATVAAVLAEGDTVDVMVLAHSARSTSASVAALQREKLGLPAMTSSRGAPPGRSGRGGRGGRGRGGNRPSLQVISGDDLSSDDGAGSVSSSAGPPAAPPRAEGAGRGRGRGTGRFKKRAPLPGAPVAAPSDSDDLQ